MERRLITQVPVYYDLVVPERGKGSPPPPGGHPLLLALHGYGQSKESMLRRVLAIGDTECAVVSIQGPHGFVRKDRQDNPKTGFNWGARYRHEESVSVHHRILLDVLKAVGTEIPVNPNAIFLLGFSQPVSFNYRFVFTYPDLIKGVVGICGGIPGDHQSAEYRPSTTDVLHIAARDDEFYTQEKVRGFSPWLETLSTSVRVEIHDGGHAIPPSSHAPILSWIRGRLPTADPD